MATIHLSAVPTFDGGQVFVEMQDAETGLRLGHATMDVRYHAGGYEAQTVIPGQEITLLMEFQAIDAIFYQPGMEFDSYLAIKVRTTLLLLVEILVPSTFYLLSLQQNYHS